MECVAVAMAAVAAQVRTTYGAFLRAIAMAAVAVTMMRRQERLRRLRRAMRRRLRRLRRRCWLTVRHPNQQVLHETVHMRCPSLLPTVWTIAFCGPTDQILIHARHHARFWRLN